MSWWHAFGAEVDLAERLQLAEPAPVWQQALVGPTDVDAEETRARFAVDDGLAYLGSWTHRPTAAELREVTPEECRDEEADALSDELDAGAELVDPEVGW